MKYSINQSINGQCSAVDSRPVLFFIKERVCLTFDGSNALPVLL